MTLAPARFLLALLLLSALAIIAVACRMPGSHLAGQVRINPPTTLLARPTSQAVQPPVILDPADFPRHGLLRLVIRWPERPQQGFRTSLIPTNAESIAVWVWAGVPGQSPQVGQPTKVARQAGQATVSVDVDLPEGRNLSVQVKAYRESNPDLAAAEAIALGTAAGINIAYNQVTSAKIVLEPLFIPAVTAFDSNFGPIGSTVTLTGLNLYDGTGSAVVVAFNGATASVVQPDASTSIRATVPAGATSGPVTVMRDGVRSTSVANFWVVGGIDLIAYKESWDPSAAGNRTVIVDQTLPFWAFPASFSAAPGDDLASLGASPSATASVGGFLEGNQAAGTFPASGSFKAGAAVATAGLRARWYGLDSQNAVTLSVEDVTVSLTPGKGKLGPFGEPSIQFQASSQLSSGATSSLVTIASLDPDKVSVQNGLAQPTASGSATGGYVTIRAVSGLHPGKTATASVVVTAAQISTLAGSGTEGSSDGTGAGAQFRFPSGVAVDATGNVYVADKDNNLIRKVTPAGAVTTLAGNGGEFLYPRGVTVDASGNVFVADTWHRRIKKVTPGGTVSNYAGSGSWGFADGMAELAQFKYPSGVAIDAAGNLYVADRDNNRIRKVFPDGTVSTLASGFSGFPSGVAVDATGNVYVADTDNNLIRKVTPTGAVSTLASGFTFPYGVAVAGNGRVYVTDSSNDRIRMVYPDGTVRTLAGGGGEFYYPSGVCVNGAGVLYAADSSAHRIRKISDKPLVGQYLGDLAVEIE